jgi:hypothetical protein
LHSCDELIHFTPQSSSKSYIAEDYNIHLRKTLFRPQQHVKQASKQKHAKARKKQNIHGTRSQSFVLMATRDEATIQTEINRLAAARNQVKQTVTKTTSERDSRKKELDRLYQAITRKQEELYPPVATKQVRRAELHRVHSNRHYRKTKQQLEQTTTGTMKMFGFGKTPQEREHEE